MQWLRSAAKGNGDDVAIWVSTPVFATFALAMGIAPAQVFWSLRYHPVRLPEIDGYITYGSWGEESVLVPDVEAAVALLHDQLRPGDVVLVKASKVAGLWRVAESLLEAPDSHSHERSNGGTA